MDCFFFVSKPLTLVALFLILLFAPPSMADDDNNNNVKGGGVFVRDIAANSSQSPPPMSSENNASSVPFRPSMLVIVVALAGIFSVVFLVLLYAKHCAGGGVVVVTAFDSDLSEAKRKASTAQFVSIDSTPTKSFGSSRNASTRSMSNASTHGSMLIRRVHSVDTVSTQKIFSSSTETHLQNLAKTAPMRSFWT